MPRRPTPKQPRKRLLLYSGVTLGLIVIGAIAAMAYVAKSPIAARMPNSTSQNSAGAQSAAAPSATNQQAAGPNTGLQSLLESIVAAKGDYAITVVEPDGRTTSVHGDKQYTAASTYKLFIAYGVFHQINNGTLQWSDPITGGYNAQTCFELMIVQSNNDCTYAFGDKIGWQTVDTLMEGIGLQHTQVKRQDNLTTANDLALFLSQLQAGTLLNNTDQQKLLDVMKRQVYRQGIPAGTGVTVADKVGFLNALLHDAGIVYGAKGPYVLVIMTNGSSWSQLADAAKQVHNFIQQ